MSLFKETLLKGNKRKMYLDFYESEVAVTAFHDREASQYYVALDTHMNSGDEDSMIAHEMIIAANRLVQAYRETVRRHEEIHPIPVEGEALHLAWHMAYMSGLAWAEANLFSIVESEQKKEPQTEDHDLNGLIESFRRLSRKALEVDKKFLNQLKPTRSEFNEIMIRSNEVVEAENWQPLPLLSY